MTKKILIKEDALEDNHPYDGQISFLPGQTNDYLDRLVAVEEYNDLFSTVYDDLYGYLYDSKESTIIYRGVDIALCFKKDLFDFAFYALQRYEAIKRILFNIPDSILCVRKRPDHFSKPSIYQILKSGPLGKDSRILFKESAVMIESSQENSTWKGNLKRFFWPSKIKRIRSKSIRTVIFSDYEKCKSILNHLPPTQSLFMADTKCPRIYFKMILQGFSFYQVCRSDKNSDLKRYKDSEFLKRCLSNTYFSSLRVGELDANLLLTSKIHHLVRTALPSLMEFIDEVHALFKKQTNLKTALVDEDIRLAKNAFCQVAKQYGVTTFVECHAALAMRHGFLPLTADYICVWGIKQKNKLEQWGCPKNRILVTGRSRYHPYSIMNPAETRSRIVGKYRFDPQKPFVLVACRPIAFLGLYLENTTQRTIDQILEAIARLGNAQFLIKLHPADKNESYYNQWVLRKGLTNVRIVRDEDPMLLAKAADFIIVNSSTYAIDGFAMDKVVVLYTDRLPSGVEEFSAYDVFWEVNSPEQLVGVVDRLIAKTDPRKGRWLEAREKCLNEVPGRTPEKTLSEYLVKGNAGIAH